MRAPYLCGLVVTLAVALGAGACGGRAAPPVVVCPPPLTVLPAAAPPPQAPKAPVALEEYFKIGRVTGLSFSADERLVAYMSDEGGRPDLWVRPLAGGPATQVTHAEGFLHSFAFSPKGDLLAFAADKGGDELPHVYLTNAKGEAPRDISNVGPGRRAELVGWASDARTLLFLSSALDEASLDLYEYDLADGGRSGKTTLLWNARGKYELALASEDHRRFVVSETRSDADNDLYLVDRADPAQRQILLTKHTGEVQYAAQYLSRDGRTLFLTSDQEGEFTALYAMDLTSPTHAMTPVLKDEWDVEAADRSRSGRYAFTRSNADGVSKLVLTEGASRKVVALPAPPGGGGWDPYQDTLDGQTELGFSSSERYLGVILRNDTAPASPFVIDLKAGTATAVADPRPASLRERTMVAGVLVRVTSFDGEKVPAFLYAPPGPGPFPAVIDVHGGPQWQSHLEFSRIRQYLVSKGYVVLVPNVRGSTGYGKRWRKKDDLDLGGGPLKDIVACKQYLVEYAHVAADKVVVMGGSYGGYMALAAEAFTPDEFAANIDYFGVSDLKTAALGFPAYWAFASGALYQKWGDPNNPAHAAYQHDRSPLNFVDRMTRPLLVVQGEKDARVKADQSERIVAALRKRGVPVHYLLLPGEGHGFTKNESYLKTYQATDRFLDRYVWGDTRVMVDD